MTAVNWTTRPWAHIETMQLRRSTNFPCWLLSIQPEASSVCLACLDNIGFGATHTYLYPWSTVARGFSARNAQFLTYTNGVMQAITGMIIGLIIYRIRSYKWILVAGAVIHLIGYGIMIRLRTSDSSVAELFIVQLVQGLGSGIIETLAIVAAQIVVPHLELAQVTSLIMLSSFLGNGIGSAIAGGIYTDALRNRLRFRLGSGISEERVDKLYNSITQPGLLGCDGVGRLLFYFEWPR